MTALAEHRLVLAATALATIAVGSTRAAAGERVHHHRLHAAVRPAPAQARPPLDDLYRRRGYGIGGPIFGGDTALAGTCADLRFAEPASCGRGYGIYGNGLGNRFGF